MRALAQKAAAWRASCPALLPAISFVTGQWAGLTAPIYSFLVVAGMAALVRGPFLVSFACGALSGAAAAPHGKPPPRDDAIHYAVVDSEPRYRAPGGVEVSLTILESSDGSAGKGARVLCRAVHLPWRSLDSVHSGATYLVRGKFRALEIGADPFSYDSRLARHGYRAKCKLVHAARVGGHEPLLSRIRGAIAEDAESKAGPSEATGLFLAMSIGTKDRLTERTERAFEKTGLAHLLVVSGYQITLVFQMLATLCRQTVSRFLTVRVAFIGVAFAEISASAAACAFVALAGADSSSVRAGIATLVVVTSRLSERRSSMLASMLFSMVVLSVIWPGTLFEPGAQLTYAALLGIALGSRAGRGSAVSTFLRVNVLAYALASIVVLFWFGYLAPAGLLLNPFVSPLASVIACNLGLAGIAASLGGLDREGLMIQLCARFCGALRDLLVDTAEWMPDIEVRSLYGKLTASLAILLAVSPLARATKGRSAEAGITRYRGLSSP